MKSPIELKKDSFTTKKDSSKQRFFELDVFRGLAALGILVFHYTIIYNNNYQHAPEMNFYFPWGRHGVGVFFIISGFVILMTLERTKKSLDFIVSRFSRLYPVYWVAVIFTFIIVRFSQLHPSETQATINLKEALLNLTMIQGFWKIPNVDGVYWTLQAELCFYGMMFLIYQCKLLKYIDRVATAWLVFSLIISIKTYLARWGYLSLNLDNPHQLYSQVVMMGGSDLFLEYSQGIRKFILVFLNTKFAHLFIIGMMLYREKIEGFSFYRWGLIISCILAQKVAYSWEHSWETTIAIAIFTVVLFLATRNYLKFITIKPLVFLGMISYSLYLIHQNVGYAIIRELYKFDVHPYLSIAIAACISITLAITMTFAIEQPALHFLRTKYRQVTTPK
jgi:peptidoglycan/LPS O-acetylase OafA/YrhL